MNREHKVKGDVAVAPKTGAMDSYIAETPAATIRIAITA